MKEENIKKYKWMQIPDFNLVPTEMLKEAEGERYISKLLYKNGDKILNDKLHSLLLLVNSGTVYGFMFTCYNPFKNSLDILLFYVSEELGEKILDRTKDELMELIEKKKYKSVSWLTSNHELANKLGFVKTEQVMMELKEE